MRKLRANARYSLTYMFYGHGFDRVRLMPKAMERFSLSSCFLRVYMRPSRLVHVNSRMAHVNSRMAHVNSRMAHVNSRMRPVVGSRMHC